MSRCKVKLLLCLFSAALFGCTVISPITPLDFKQEKISFDAPNPKEWRLKNGLTVIHLQDNELPLVYGSLYFPGGSYWQNEDELGTVSAMGSLLRDGGAGERSAAQLDNDLDKLAAGISSSFSQEWGKVNFSTLDTDLDTTFSMFSDVVLRPRFSEERLQLWKGNVIDSIKRRIDNPDEVAQIAFVQLIYRDSFLGRVSTVADIAKINRADLVRMYNKFVKPADAILTVGGNITETQLNRLLEKHFGNWRGKSELAALPGQVNDPKPGIYFVSLPISQSNILIGELGVPRLTPDYPAIDTFNEIFGSSGFGLSRLFARIRTELGLAYSVYGSIRPGLIRGVNMISVQTKAQSTDVAAIESIKVLNSMKNELVPSEELDEVKRSIENSFIFNFESTSSILGRRASLKLMGFPEDFDDTYLPRLRSVTVKDVQEVAQRRWNPSKFVIVVVGNEDAYHQVSKRLKEEPGLLAGMTLQKVKFDQKLLL